MAEEAGGEKIPKSFVFKYGKVTSALAALASNLRKCAEPYTAKKLAERKQNRLKDFRQASAQFGVTHLLYVCQNTHGSSFLRMYRSPQGPTLSFRILAYSLMRDVQEITGKKLSPGSAYMAVPFAVFSAFDEHASLPHIALARSFLANIYPAIDVEKAKLSNCRRVVHYHYHAEEDAIYYRHYLIVIGMAGVSHELESLLTGNHVPDLSELRDISQMFGDNFDGTADDYPTTQSDVVTLPASCGERSNQRGQKRKVNLVEIGPRLTLQLARIKQDDGSVLYERQKGSPE